MVTHHILPIFAGGQLNREINIYLAPFATENLVSRDGFGSLARRFRQFRETVSAVSSRVSLLISVLRVNLLVLITYGIPPEFRGGVHLFI